MIDLIQKKNLLKSKALGIRNPIRNSQRTGIFDATYTTLDLVKSKIYTLMFTQPGTRVMLPEFGSPIYDIQFDQLSDANFKSIESDIINSVKRWVPEAKITQLQIKQTKSSPNQFVIDIGFALVDNPTLTDNIVINAG